MAPSILKHTNTSIATKIIAIIVTAFGFIVMISWIFNIPALRAIPSGTITMKFITSLCFFLSGILLYYTTKTTRILNVESNDTEQIIIFNTAVVILLIMGTLFFATIFKINTGIETMIIGEQHPAEKTSFLGAPAIPAMIAFILTAISGLLNIFGVNEKQFNINGTIILLIGAIALLGYILNIPQLYYFYPEITNPIALSTALIITLLGCGFLILRNDNKEAKK